MALSAMEMEFMACLAAAQEVAWLRRFFQDLGVVTYAFNPVIIYCDSIVALAYMKDPKCHDKIKYINVKYHYICEVAK